ncbi:MAG: polysaccharide biosynthesis/export family protein, partial [Candidatus Omnitrophica bacterium]|nr:polysaccharide biosynthesis/export family protein [Candidatus Omnitrophota bacterium]
MRSVFSLIILVLIPVCCYPQDNAQLQSLNSGDILEISVEAFNRPPLQETTEVSMEGEAYCPIIGKLKVSGLNVEKVKEAISSELKKKYFIEAKINIEIKSVGKLSLKKQQSQERAQERIARIKAVLDNIHPYAEVGESFNDNIYLTNENTTSDFITVIKPGIKYHKVTSSEKRTDIYLDAGAKAMVYSDVSANNTINPYAKFLLNYGLGKLGLKANANIAKNQETYTDLEATALGGLVDYWNSGYGANLNIDLNRFVWDLRYRHDYRVYENEPFKSASTYTDDVSSLTGAVRIFTKTYFLLEYSNRWRRYPKHGAEDRVHDTYWAGIRGKISPKINGTIKFGYEKTKYDSGERKTGSDIFIKLSYQPSNRVTYNLDVEKGIGASSMIDEDLNDAQVYRLGWNYVPAFNKRLMFRSSIDYGYYDY